MKLVVTGTDLELGPVVAEELVGGESVEVDDLARVPARQGQARRQDLGEVAVLLAPERRAPRGVQALDRLVAGAEPAPEGLGALVVVAERVVAAEFVRHVPELDGGVRAVALGDALDEFEGVATEDRGRRAPGLATAGEARRPVLGLGEDLRVPERQPRRR
jgi:hypothetical protein